MPTISIHIASQIDSWVAINSIAAHTFQHDTPAKQTTARNPCQTNDPYRAWLSWLPPKRFYECILVLPPLNRHWEPLRRPSHCSTRTRPQAALCVASSSNKKFNKIFYNLILESYSNMMSGKCCVYHRRNFIGTLEVTGYYTCYVPVYFKLINYKCLNKSFVGKNFHCRYSIW